VAGEHLPDSFELGVNRLPPRIQDRYSCTLTRLNWTLKDNLVHFRRRAPPTGDWAPRGSS
jgi:hypothetical protein